MSGVAKPTHARVNTRKAHLIHSTSQYANMRLGGLFGGGLFGVALDRHVMRAPEKDSPIL
jgi:hypothetical protein